MPLKAQSTFWTTWTFLRRRIFSRNLCWRHYIHFSSWAYDLTHRSQWRIQGRGQGGPPPPYFSTKMRPEGPNTIFWGTGPPPLSEGLDDRPPPTYLKVWIRHWKSWPKIKFKSWQTWLTWAICAIWSSLQAVLKKTSAIENCEIAKWQKI